MQTTLTDWQGKLRIADVTGDALRIVVRHGAWLTLGPTIGLGLAGAALEFVVIPHEDLGNAAEAAQLLLSLPLTAFVWAWFSHRLAGPHGTGSGHRRQITRATVLAGAIGLAQSAAVAWNPWASAVLVGLAVLASVAVPVCASEPIGMFAALRRAMALTSGSRARLLGAWLLLQLVAALFSFALGLAAFVALHRQGELGWAMGWSLLLLVESLTLAVSMAMTFALSIAAYRRLRSARVDVDVERLVEVFR